MTMLSLSLSILVILALFILLWPLYQSHKKRKDQQINKSIIAIALFIPLFSMGTYFVLGTPEFADIAQPKAAPQQITLVDKLEQKLQQNPKDLSGWLLLGRSYMVTETYPKAIQAFEKAHQLAPDDANILVSLADAIAIDRQGQLTGRPYELLNRAYQIDDHNQTALWLLGLAEKQLGQPEKAANHWLKLYRLLPEGHDDKLRVKALLATVGHEVVESGVDSQSSPETAAPNPTQTTSNSVTFDLDGVQAEPHPNATVFVYAKQVGGMPMPVAAIKHPWHQLPTQLTLDETHQIMPTRKINHYQKLLIGIKISVDSTQDSEEIFKQEQLVNHQGSNQIIINFTY